MSNQEITQLWKNAQKDLENLAIKDYECQDVEPQFERPIVQKSLFELYVKYITLVNRLEIIYDELIQPQKRILVRKLFDSCLGRVIEIKHDLVNVDMSEFSYNDAIMEQLRLTPIDIELKIPRYFRREREQEIQERMKFIDNLLIKLGWLEEECIPERMTEIEAIKMIQMHERARQGRLRAQFMKEIRMLKEKSKPDTGGKERTDGLVAAMKIQKVWRGFATRRKTRRRKLEEMYLIGMIQRPGPKKLQTYRDADKEFMQQRYKLQAEYQKDFNESLNCTKTEISTKQGVAITQEIGDEIRIWFKDYHIRTGKFPEFPSEDHGGSRHLLSRQATESEISRSSAVSSKDSKKAKDNKTPTKTGDLNIEENFDNGYKPSQSLFLSDIKLGIDEFNEVWREKDETFNTKQSHYEDMIYQDKHTEVETELRKIVDDIMRQELELLQAALDKDRATRGKKSKKNNKPRRSGKKNKKKKEKDLTPDRTTESLFEELVANGIIRKYPEIYLKSYLGDRSYNERSEINPTPGDIRQVIMEYCILPLGSETIRNFAPCVRSVLITGPKGTGKKALVHSICTEVGGILFDLTPANIVGKYPGKSGLIMLIHLVTKVSRLLQPSIIYMDDAEKPFMKKVPKGDRTDPKRLKKDLPKLIKNINTEDRVLFIGTTNAPWEADQKVFQQTYNRFIYIPRPDYGTLSFAWKELLSEYTSISPQFDYGAMAKISDGYTIGSIVSCLKEVITCKRNLQLRVHPLTHFELINALSLRDPVYREEEEAFVAWWSKTPLGRRKQRVMEIELEAKLEKEQNNAQNKKKSTKK